MWALVLKEFRQVRRDRRTLAMMIVLPLLLLIVFGYAASFDVSDIPTAVVGPGAAIASGHLPSVFHVVKTDPTGGRDEATELLRDGDAVVAVVADPASPAVLISGADLFSAKAAEVALARAVQAQSAQAPSTTAAAPQQTTPLPTNVKVEVLFNPDLKTSAVMVPALAGMILLFIGTITTSLGVVRERQAGTLELLAVMPFRPRDVFVGKLAPYFLIAVIDLTVVVGAGTLLFDVPFNGSVAVLALGALLFLFVTLGLGVLISSVSQNSGQAIQLAMMMLLPQILLSGLIFPVASMAPGVRWISYLLPLTYFNQISRGVMLRGAGIGALAGSFLMLTLMSVVVFGLAVFRFRGYLAPAEKRHRAPKAVAAEATR